MDPRKKKRLALFSYNPESQRYDTRFNTTLSIPEQMDGHFSMEEAREFLAEPESQLTQYYKCFPPRLNKLLRSRSVMIFATLMKIPLGLIGIRILVLRESLKDEQVRFILFILLGVCGFIAITPLFVSYFWNQAKQKHSFKVMENIQAHIQETYSYYQRKDLVWTIYDYADLISMRHGSDPKEPKGHHIELWKYDSMQDQPNEHHEPQQQNFQRSAGLIEEFVFNIDSLKFENTFTPLWTDDQVSFEEVKQFLDLATPSFSQYYQSTASIWAVGKWGFTGFALLTIFNFVWGLDFVDGLYLALCSSAYIIIITIIMLCYIKNLYKKDGEIIPNVQAIIEQTASQVNAKGFRWVLSQRYYKSVELWKDKSLQVESFQDIEIQGPGQLPVQFNADTHEALENKDSEISQGLLPTQTQDNLPLLSQDAGADSFLDFLRQQKDIVFYYNSKFLCHHYFPGLTENKVSTAEIRTFLNEIESRFALYRRTCFSRFVRVSLFLTFLVGFVIINASLCFGYLNLMPFASAFGFIVCAWAVLVLVSLCLFRVHCSRMRKQMFEATLQRASEYDQKGLKWFIPEDTYPIIVLRDKNAVMEPYIP